MDGPTSGPRKGSAVSLSYVLTANTTRSTRTDLRGVLLGTRADLPVAQGTTHVQALRPDGLQMRAPRDEHHVVVGPREQRAVVAAHGARAQNGDFHWDCVAAR